ncbi:28950_t:CDS:1, partial [Racocetra persica]
LSREIAGAIVLSLRARYISRQAQKEYPILSLIARDYLAIQATSVAKFQIEVGTGFIPKSD